MVTAITLDPPSIHLGVGSERPLSQRVNRPRVTRPAGAYQTTEFLNSKAGEILSTKGQFARAANGVLGKYRLETAQEEQHKGMSVVRGDRLDLI